MSPNERRPWEGSSDPEEWAIGFAQTFIGMEIRDYPGHGPATVTFDDLLAWFTNAMLAGNVPRSIATMQSEVLENNIAHGWYDESRAFGDEIALLHTEVSEAYEAWRHWGMDDATEPKDPMRQGWIPKPEGIGSEIADVFIRLLDTCHRHDIDLEAEYERKMEYNRTRPYKHGGKAT